MRKLQLLLTLLFTVILFNPSFAQRKITRQEYIQKYQDIAKRQMQNYGIPASIIMAQALLESGDGNSTLAVKANNHFGIKCHSTWTGPKVYHDDDAKGECFRKYKSPERSFQDHSEFLRGSRRYAFLFDLNPLDYSGWAVGLSRAGYATDPDYPKKLIRLIQENKLNLLDRGIEIKIESPTKGTGELVDPETFTIDIFKQRDVYMRNRIKYIKVKKGDTYQSLTKELELMPWQLAKYNEIDSHSRLKEGQELYIQPKRRKAEPNHPLHVVEEGQSMYDISQMYGVKLKSIYRRNRMEPGTQPDVGEKVFLRGRKPKD
jgi:LysM repeat protein